MVHWTILTALWWCSLPSTTLSRPIANGAIEVRQNPDFQYYSSPSQAFTAYASADPFAGPFGDEAVSFYMQGDGNFVAYAGPPSTTSSVFNSGTPGHSLCNEPQQCSLNWQTDGNLVIYQQTTALWDTQTNGRGALLILSGSRPYVSILDSAGNTIYSSGGSTPPPRNPPTCGGADLSERCVQP